MVGDLYMYFCFTLWHFNIVATLAFKGGDMAYGMMSAAVVEL